MQIPYVRIGLVRRREGEEPVEIGNAEWKADSTTRGMVYDWIPTMVAAAESLGATFAAWAEVVLEDGVYRVETLYWDGDADHLADELWIRLLHARTPLP